MFNNHFLIDIYSKQVTKEKSPQKPVGRFARYAIPVTAMAF